MHEEALSAYVKKVASLSGKSAKVLLILLTIGKEETTFNREEFAVLAGLSGRSILDALRELDGIGLITSIQHYGKPIQVRLVGNYAEKGSEKIHEKTSLVPEADLASPCEVPAVIPEPTLVSLPTDVPTRDEDGHLTDGTSGALDVLAVCRNADKVGIRKEQVVALQKVWDVTFPVEEYPYQRLTQDTANRFLANRSAEEVGRAILNAPAQAKEHINLPRNYIESVLLASDKRRETEGEGITDEFRTWAHAVMEQYEKNKGK